MCFEGLSGDQFSSFIVNRTGWFVDDGHGNMIIAVGYQNVLYVTCALYIIALLISFFLVKAKKEKAE